jgi:hypothetical protein
MQNPSPEIPGRVIFLSCPTEKDEKEQNDVLLIKKEIVLLQPFLEKLAETQENQQIQHAYNSTTGS